MTFSHMFRIIFAACVIGGAANASTIFNFDADSPGTATSFTDTVNGLSATFSSPGDPGGFVIYPTIFDTLTGNVLGDPGPAGLDNLMLDVAFSQNLTAVTLDFATSDFSSPSPLIVSAYENAQLVGSVQATGNFLAGFTFPEGQITFNGATFNNIVISSSATDFAIDNIAAVATPEPALSGLLALGLAAIVIGSRRARSRPAARLNS